MDDKKDLKKPLIHGLYEKPMSGADIEARSFAIIDGEAPSHHYSLQEWEVVRRMIHTVGDFGILGEVRFSAAAITAAEAALKKGCPLYVDSNMIRNGLSLERLRSAYPHYGWGQIHCHIADDDVAREAREQGLPRSLFAVRKAKAVLDGGIAVFGNAPVALLELNRFIMEEGLRPALVVAMPVGFVHVIESKEELMSLGVPYITLTGRRGGSPLAVSVIHALCSLAVQPGPRKENDC
ncbi:MAG: precorrin-8X methylmutase [Syntrophales bacterium]